MSGPTDSRSMHTALTAAQHAFGENAERWASYTVSPLGQLRENLVLHHLQEHLASCLPGLRVLDVGGGIGGYSLALAQQGHQVCLLDFSQDMLDMARTKVQTEDPSALSRIEFCQCPAEDATQEFSTCRFDIILCHTILEYLDSPKGILQNLATLLSSGGIISILIVNPVSEPLKWVLVKKDFTRAIEALSEQALQADLFGLPRHTIPLRTVIEVMNEAGIQVVAEYGIRIFADYLSPDELVNEDFYTQLWQLELAASQLEPYKRLARYIHIIGTNTTRNL